MVSMKLEVARQTERYRKAAISMDDRPMFHLTPACGWMNDPSGLSFYRGEYHLFYLYNPYSTSWDSMHWGHVTSGDLLHWNYLPCALAPDSDFDRGGCLSGSAAIIADGRHLLMYTGLQESTGVTVERGRKTYLEVLNLAIGDGIDYVKYSGNPVVGGFMFPRGAAGAGFRDPKIIEEKDGRYVALVVDRAPDGNGQIQMYRSGDLFSWKYWKLLIKNDGRFGRLWECPDFFEIDGKWVLLVSTPEMQRNMPDYQGGSCTVAIAGEYDPETGVFTPECDQTIDYGTDFYAPQTILAPDGRRIMIALMQNRQSGHKPGSARPWAGQMTIPRELSFVCGRICQKPIRELENFYTDTVRYQNVPVSDEVTLYWVTGRMNDIEIDVRPVPGEPSYQAFSVCFAMDDTQRSAVRFEPGSGNMTIDRGNSESEYPASHECQCHVPESMDGNIKIRLILDKDSAEVFINDGRYVMSAAIFTNTDADRISFIAEGQAIIDVTKRGIRI